MKTWKKEREKEVRREEKINKRKKRNQDWENKNRGYKQQIKDSGGKE